jgi:hypothetical protein
VGSPRDKCSRYALEGETVTFDSFPKSDGSRKSEYGKYDKKTGAYQHVIKYPGITIDHVMASGTLPEIWIERIKIEHVTFGMEVY